MAFAFGGLYSLSTYMLLHLPHEIPLRMSWMMESNMVDHALSKEWEALRAQGRIH